MGTLAWQGSLLEASQPPDARLTTAALIRRHLAHGAWIDHAAGWMPDSDRLFAAAVDLLPFAGRREMMYGRQVEQPRLTAALRTEDLPAGLAPLREAAAVLSQHYGVWLERVGFNLYRDGADSVAWHGDKVARDRHSAIIAIVSLGEPRPFRLRPRDGGTGVEYRPGHGDLLVMGGTCQRTWRHAVPKVARAGPRISVMFRHRYPPLPPP